MIVNDAPSSVIAEPTTRGSRPKRRVQRFDAMTAKASLPAASSPAANVRPIRGRTPRSLKKSAETRAARSRSGVSPPLELNVQREDAAILSIVRSEEHTSELHA